MTGVMGTKNREHPAGCKVPCRLRSLETCTRDLGHRCLGVLGRQNVGKVAGLKRPVSGASARGGGDRSSYLQESDASDSLGSAVPPALQGSGLSARPAAAAAAARKAWLPPSVGLSSSSGAQSPREPQAGGAGRGWPVGNASWVPAPPATWLLPAPIPAEGTGRSALPRTAAGSGGVWPQDRQRGGWTERGAAGWDSRLR